MSRNKSSFLLYLPLFWPFWQSQAAVESLIYILLYTDMHKVIHQSSLLSKHKASHTPLSHISLIHILPKLDLPHTYENPVAESTLV